MNPIEVTALCVGMTVLMALPTSVMVLVMARLAGRNRELLQKILRRLQ